MKKITVTAILLLLTIAATAQTTRYINPTGTDTGNCTDSSNACATIDYAMDMAGSGDVIDIAAGIYTERLNISKDLILQGAGNTQPGGTIIQAHASSGQATGSVINIDGNYSIQISGLTIRHGVATIGGGLNNVHSNLTLTNVTLTENIADYGGGMYNDSGTLTLTDVNFTNNVSIVSGGGLNNYTPNEVIVLNGVQFSGNTAGHAAGGVALYGGNTVFTNVIFDNNIAENSDSGGLYVSNTTATFTNISFTGNEAGEDGNGGAVYIDESTVDFINADFTGNSSPNLGGAVYITESIVDFSGATFIGNEALVGGGLLVQTQSTATLYDVLFEGNKAPISSSGMASGGGMAVLGSDATIHNTRFKDNEAGVFGGGLVNEAANTTLVNTLLTGNIANKAGGAIANAGDLDITNTTISKNEGLDDGAGGIYSLGGAVTLKNSIVWGNIGSEAPDIANVGDFIGSYSLYDDTDVFNEGTLTCDDCLTINPAFEDAAGGDFTLSGNSPAIDAGDPNTDLSVFPTDGNNNP